MRTINTKALFITVSLALTSLAANAQELPKVFGKTINEASVNNETGKIRCVTTEYKQYLENESSERATSIAFENWMAQKIAERRAARGTESTLNTTEVITIPVVVHIIHNGDPVGSNENLADAQVLSQITVLNQDYRRMAGTPGYNTNAVGADVEIEFCLAQTAPDGSLTNGIDRVNLGQSSWGENAIENTLKPNTIWDPTQYFNIWVCRFGGGLSGVLGYAHPPSGSGLPGLDNNGGSANTDGVIIGYEYFGSAALYPQGTYGGPYNGGRTTTHEIGHSLGLIHTWGPTFNNSSCNSSDHCADTPTSSGPNGGCSANYSCGSNDMIENYMDYTNDACMNIFTQDQKERMLIVMENSPRRASLKTSTVCQVPASREDFNLLNGINLYPNPTQDVLNIAIASNELPDSYVIYNNLGQTMVEVNVTSENNLKLNTSNYSNGIYFIRIEKGNESKVLKFIKN
ncbi:MAG: hypothetical protein BM557_02635 [Flavobacterium sp. MedPE-SWcel]|uniref:T9SS type A sorting domain-containing protein n=1 Tax=uncultured Flavobacterium sp. TaxID=165435 RepID=UPI000915294B|nr:T9SS type A sorting domain-containing protein [uncultured Flavobacterium sp.]OIQ21713.1 MAG: hypothetical protein BM557_02635 [Flavobacterium sp. MedPE-SWcel]